MPVLRDQALRTKQVPPASQGWLDLNPAGPVDATIIPNVSTGVAAPGNVYYIDTNHNQIYDSGEPIWRQDAGSASGKYTASAVLLGGSPPSGATGIANQALWADFNGDGIVQSDELIAGNGETIQGSTAVGSGTYCYRDDAAIGHWTSGDPIWLDANGNHQFDSGETVVYGIAPSVGAWGKNNGLYYHDFGDSSHRLIWVDSTDFHQDFANAYQALDTLVPLFSLAGHDDIRASVGALLSGAPSVSVSNTVSMTVATASPFNTTVVSGSGFVAAGVLPGDSIQINGTWYQTIAVSDSALTLAQPYYGSPYASPAVTSQTASSFNLRSWTKVAALAASGSDPAFAYERGVPGSSSILFKQQYDELASVASQLVGMKLYYPPRQVWSKAQSDAIIAAATAVIDDYAAIFGDSNSLSSIAALEIALRSHKYDPGADVDASIVGTLLDMDESVASASHDLTATGRPTYRTEQAGWIPTNFDSLDLLTQLSDIQSYATAMAPHLWLDAGAVTIGTTVDDIGPVMAEFNADHTGSNPTFGQYELTGDDATPDMDALPYNDTYEWHNHPPFMGHEFLALNNNDLNKAHYDGGGIGPSFGAYMYYSGTTLNLRVPTTANPDGGDAMSDSSISFVPHGYSGPAITLGSSPQIIYTRAELHGLLEDGYADAPTGTPSPTNPDDWHRSNVELQDASGNGLGLYLSSEYRITAPGNTTTEANIYYIYSAPEIYGRVPVRSFSYTATDPNASLPTPPTMTAAPYVPPTSKMDYLNVVPDTNLDGIVQTDHDQTTFGDDTGSMQWQMQRGMPQAFIPLNTDSTDGVSASNLPIAAYLQQGAFGDSASSVGSLSNDYITYGDADQDGLSVAYSLDTRSSNLLLLSSGANHIKRLEITRPGGNSVVFDFPWNSATHQFDPVGTPFDEGGRDNRMLYVLRDLSPGTNTDLNYQMLFASGITQTFDAGTGALAQVGDVNSGLTATVTPDIGTDYTGDPAEVNTPRYKIDFQFSGGKISEVDYTTHEDSPGKIKTAITYDSDGNITALAKKDGSNTDIPQFSYHLEDGAILSHNDAVSVERDGTFAFGSTSDITLTTTAGDNDSYQSDESVFNSNGLVTSDTITLSEDGTATTSAETDYSYSTLTTRYSRNQSPQWGKVTDIVYPDSSWEHFAYDSDTGWLIDDYTPYQNSASSSLSSASDEHYDYNASDSDSGDPSDPIELIERPRETTDSIASTTTGIRFAKYFGTTIKTKSAPSGSGTWGTGVLGTSTIISGYDSYTETGPDGKTVHTGNGGEDQTTTSFDGNTISTDNTYTNAFGYLSNPTDKGTDQSTAVGSEPDTIIPGKSDAFGRPLSETEDGLKTIDDSYNWEGLTAETAPDGQETDYTYTDLGQIRTEDAGGLTTTYYYDAAGNVTRTKVTSDTPVTGEDHETDTYATFDAQGRQTSTTDELGNETDYSFSSGSSGTTETVAFKPSGGTSSTIETIVSDLDGTEVSDSGSSVATPSTADEGIVTSDTTIDGVTIPAGSTWARNDTNGTGDESKIYYNLLGEEILTTQTGPHIGSSDSTQYDVINYDDNGRPIEETGFDGTMTHTDYSPITGEVDESWVDVNGDGDFDPGTDSQQRSTPSPITTNDGNYVGNTSVDDSTAGSEQDFSGSRNGGLDTEDIANGEVTTTHTAIGTGGADTVTTTNPDGTQTVDTYEDGFITEEDTYDDSSHTTLEAKTTFGYDDLNRNTTVTDWQHGTSAGLTVPMATTYNYRLDGSILSEVTPNGTVSYSNFDTQSGVPKTISTPSGTITQTVDNQGRVTSDSGGGTTPSLYGYNSTTGNLDDFTIFKSGTVGTTSSSDAETTHYTYDNSGNVTNMKYGVSGTTALYAESYLYNNKGEVTGITRPAATVGSFVYDAAGDLLGSTTTDTGGGSSNGTTFADSTKLDDQGRPINVSETENDGSGHVAGAANAFTYDPVSGQLASETQVAGVATKYDYFGPNDDGPGQVPGALKDMMQVQNEVTLSVDAYTYDDAGRLATDTLNGTTTFTYSYIGGTSAISSVAVTVAGVSGNVTTAYGYNSIDQLNAISTTSGGTSFYSAGFTYNSDTTRATESVTELKSDNTTTDTHGWTFGYDGQQQLTSVANTSDSSAVNSYSYNAIGDRSDLGTVNALNQYSDFHYTANGNIYDDGTDSYTYDAKNRLTRIQPDSPSDGDEGDLFTYDAQDRRVGKVVFYYDASTTTYVFAHSYSFIYDTWGDITAEVDATTNDVVETFTYTGPNQLQSITDDTGSAPQTYIAIDEPDGTTDELIDASSHEVAATWRYDAWGNLISSSGNVALNPFGFQGGQKDGGANVRMGVRELNTQDRVWLQMDPSGQGNSPNLYQPLANDPVDMTDPNGLRVMRSADPEQDHRIQQEIANQQYKDADLRMMLSGQSTVTTGDDISWAKVAEVIRVAINPYIHGWGEAVKAVGGAAESSVQAEFDEATWDRTHGVGDAATSRGTRAIHAVEVLADAGVRKATGTDLRLSRFIEPIDSVVGFTFDGEERANAALVGGSIIDVTALAVGVVSGGSALQALLEGGGAGVAISGIVVNGNTVVGLVINGASVPLTATALAGAGLTTGATYNLLNSVSNGSIPAQDPKPVDSTRKRHGTPEHDATAFNQAKHWGADPTTEEVRFNQNLVDLAGNEIPEFRPDAQRIRLTSKGKRVIDVLEVRSPSQSAKFMDDKIAAIKKALGPQAGQVKWIDPANVVRK